MCMPSCLINSAFLSEASDPAATGRPTKSTPVEATGVRGGLIGTGFSVSVQAVHHRPFRATTGEREGGRTWPERMEVEATGRW